jgi:hypothetical protein
MAHQPTLRWLELHECPLETGNWSSVHEKLKPFLPDSELGSDALTEFCDSNLPDAFFNGSCWVDWGHEDDEPESD